MHRCKCTTNNDNHLQYKTKIRALINYSDGDFQLKKASLSFSTDISDDAEMMHRVVALFLRVTYCI